MALVAGVLPAVLGMVWFLINRHRGFLGMERLSRRGSLVLAFLVFQLLVDILTELTSLGHHFTGRTVGLAWLSVLAAVVAMCRRELADGLQVRRRGACLVIVARSSFHDERFWAAAGFAWLTVLVAVAWFYRPSNGDSLVYHLARVAHWVQDASVTHYATHYLAQVEFAPLHEYNLAHLHLLSGSDRLDGYVQLVATVVAIAGASEIARLLGGSRRAQLFTAVVAATIPSVILEATSTQNNDFGAAIGVALLLLVLCWKPFDTPLPGAVLIGVAAGEALLSKGTLLAFFAPVCLFLLVTAIVPELRRRRLGTLARRLAAGGALALAAAALVAGPFLFRNIQLFDGPTGPVSKSTISSELTPRAAAANVVRSTASNFSIGDGRNGVRTHVSRLVLRSAERIFNGLGVEGHDQRYALGTELDAFQVGDHSRRERVEEVGANPWHVVLLVGAGCVLLASVARGDAGDRRALLIAVGLMTGYLLFTGTARWSIFAVRYYIPLLIAWSPLIALVLVRLRPWMSRTLLVALSVACLPQLLDNTTRSILHPKWRTDSFLDPYFASEEALRVASPSAAYERLSTAIAQGSCDRLGIANWILVEYPIWVGTAHEGWKGRIEAVGVQNESRVLEVREHDPCALVRQVKADFVTPDDGLANLRFDSLALSSRPDLMTRVGADAPGFESGAAGVELRPGGGWRLGGTAPSVIGRGTVYVTTDAVRSLRVQFLGAPPGMEVEKVEPSGEARPVVTAESADGTAVDLVFPLGTTRLVVAASAISGVAPVDFGGVTVAPS